MVEWSGLLSNKPAVAAVLASAAAVVAAYLYLSKRKRKEYELVGEVSGLYCFPIKSCSGITNNVAYCTETGIRMLNARDRTFVIVRSNGDFITQRQISKMAGVSTACDGGDLVLQAEGMPPLRVPLNPKVDKSKLVPCRVWSSHLTAQDCGQEAGTWLNTYLEENGLKLLVLAQGLTKRQCTTPSSTSKDKMAFPDKCPYHIVSEESLADLNSRIEKSPDGELTVNNFRPNILIRGTKGPWDEDSWSHLKIGKNLQMRVMEPCDRCLLTTVNPKRYERRSDGEPLKTLKSFRLFPELNPNSPMFGIFAGVDVENTIRIGDPVYAIRK